MLRLSLAPVVAVSAWILIAGIALAQEDPFAAGVRATPWLKPDEEQKLFKLPEGFEIQLVAAEPDIQKPLNMAFDERGRIWLTCTVEYPYAAPLDRPGRDSIRVLEDTDGDGRFEKVSIFADGLNIPMGIYPWKGGCVAYSIPDITHFEDTDGDGKCDKRTRLYGPFDHTRDTHGMINAMRRGFDGWVYACHGFNNDSHVKGADGHEVHLNSGNTFRFKLDGSRIEQFTHGQVNPFGMCFDELFNIFTADCHSKPIYQLIRGGYYPSFGKPHDGLGFVPPMMDHLHGSTAICGLAIYTGENFPKEYRGQFFSGNVMTSRINRNKPEYHGSTIKAVEQPDFLIAGDPWFRPVDLQIGPDGAMYVLDFYNRIIGHYEVPLPHPGRDRTSGRIWRIVYKGGDPETKPAGKPGEIDLTKMSAPELIKQLEHPNLEHRLRVQHWVGDVAGKDCAEDVLTMLGGTPSRFLAIHAIWLVETLKPTPDGLLPWYLLPEELYDFGGTHSLKTISERKEMDRIAKESAADYLFSKNSSIRRASASVTQFHPAKGYILPLINAIRKTPPEDALLLQVLKMSLRENLKQVREVSELQPMLRSKEAEEIVASVCLGFHSELAGHYLIRFVETRAVAPDLLQTYLEHAAATAPPNAVESLINVTKSKYDGDIELQSRIFQAVYAGLLKRGKAGAAESLPKWGEELAEKLIALDNADAVPWTAVPIDGLPPSENPWVLQQRVSQDGNKESMFFCSIVKGEQRTGTHRSAAFELPAKLSFWCAGHDGFPNAKLQGKNLVRLRDAKTHEVLVSSPPPRNDTAQKIEWDLSDHARKLGYVELVDGDTAGAYAWLAVGRFSIEGLNPSKRTEHLIAAADIVGKLKLQSLRPKLLELFGSSIDSAARVAIGQALVSLSPDTRAAALVAAMADPSFPAELTPRAVYAINVAADEEYLDNLKEVMKRAPTRLQTSLAETLAGDGAGAETLLGLVKAGVASPRLLTSANVKAKLDALNSDQLAEQVAAITANLPAQNEIIDKLVVERRAAYPRAKPDLQKGAALFEKHCAACHQIAGKGSVIGPQLDGIGLRGLERLVEDVLDPNRNVDVAFRTTTIRTVNGEVISGLVRREEGATLILADNKGKEISVPKDDIEEQAKGSLSLMPANVHEIVIEAEFYDLLAYLLSQKEAKEPEVK